MFLLTRPISRRPDHENLYGDLSALQLLSLASEGWLGTRQEVTLHRRKSVRRRVCKLLLSLGLITCGRGSFGQKVKHDSLAGVRRLIVGLIGLAIGRGPHVEEAVRVDCDKRVRVVHRHVGANKWIVRSTVTASLNLFLWTRCYKTDPVFNWNQGLTLSTADKYARAL